MIDLTTTQFETIEADGLPVIVGQISLTEAVVLDPKSIEKSGLPMSEVDREVKARILAMLWGRAYGDLQGIAQRIRSAAAETGDLKAMGLATELIDALRVGGREG